jgi:Fe-S cluster biogenesis protein NfuA
MVQSTPNPHALKFVVNTPVKAMGNYTYKNARECEHNPLARAVFDLDPHVKEVYFFDNYITVTQDGAADWPEIEEKIKTALLDRLKDHDPHFATPSNLQEQGMTPQTPEMTRINSILDQTVRPYLQMDGGDIHLVDYANNVLRIFYQGACGSCPSGTFGTLKAIENILREQFNPDIVVEVTDFF